MIDAFKEARLDFVFLFRNFYLQLQFCFIHWTEGGRKSEQKIVLHKKKYANASDFQERVRVNIAGKIKKWPFSRKREHKYLEAFENKRRIHDVEADSQIFRVLLPPF